MRSIEVVPTALDAAAGWLVGFAAALDDDAGALPGVGPPDVQGALADLVASLAVRRQQLCEATLACAAAVGAAADSYVAADDLRASW